MMKRMIIANKTPRAITVIGYCLLVIVLAACSGDGSQMRAQLEELERQNRADSVMTNDSLAEHLVKYFDRHGTPNERMRAHYILGRTYADMGEAPAALEAYLEAADCSDTTATDCDYHTLNRVYSQMANVFYWQNLMEDYIKACDKSIEYAWKDGDTLQALNAKAHIVAAYNRMKQYDKVIASFDDVFDNLMQAFGVEYAAKYCTLPVYALIEKGYLSKAKAYIDIYRTESGYFNTDGNVEKGREVCYYYMGLYYLLEQQIDSSEFYFRKELQTGLDADNQQMASRGLSLLFSQTHQPDSAAKYALYGYEVLDSIFARKSADEVERMAALHNYTRHQTIANREHLRAEQEKAKKEHLFVILLFVVAIVGLAWILIARKRRLEAEKYRRNVRELAQVSHNLQDLKKQKAIFEALANEEMMQKSAELAAIQQQNEKLAQQIEESNGALMLLRKEVMQLHSDKMLTNRDVDTLLEESPVYQQLKTRSVGCDALKSSEWQAIERLVKDALPGFYNLITSRQSSLRQEGRRLCFLLRLHVGLKETSVLMGVSPSKISKLSRNILLRVFQEDGSGKELIRRLEDIL
jgi:hypothetical protein